MHDWLGEVAGMALDAALPDRHSPGWYWAIWLVIFAMIVGLIVWCVMA